jgi:hypothetical protein
LEQNRRLETARGRVRAKATQHFPVSLKVATLLLERLEYRIIDGLICGIGDSFGVIVGTAFSDALDQFGITLAVSGV